MIVVSTDFPGANAVIRDIDEDCGVVRFFPDLRDTVGDWFYFAFSAEAEPGRTVTFDMSPARFVGRFGAAFSRDRVHYAFTGNVSPDGTSFTYTFRSPGEKVYFAHDLWYSPARFDAFAQERGLTVENADTDPHGQPIRRVSVGEGESVLLFTARHHACESTGNYLLEGILSEALSCPPPAGVKLVAYPFVDADGAYAGDQGKNRAPHDHNRDYVEGRYAGVRAVRSEIDRGNVLIALDLHSPWHMGGRNDVMFAVRKKHYPDEVYDRFGRLFASCLNSRALTYTPQNDIRAGVEWNKIEPEDISMSTYAGGHGVPLAMTIETTYFGTPDDPVTEDKLIETGRCLWHTCLAWLEQKKSKTDHF